MSPRPSLLIPALLVGLTACQAPPPQPWRPLEPPIPRASRLVGVWENPATGHLVSLTPEGPEVFHLLEDFCIRDEGLVPPYSLYRFGASRDELLVHYFDYRDQPELLQAPLAFRRRPALPPACLEPASTEDSREPAEVFALVVQAFERFYAFFDVRGVDWDELVARYEPLARDAASHQELYELLTQMLEPLGDGHVNLSWSGYAFNAGDPRLRQRLREAWEASGSPLTESAYVTAWHRGVLRSVEKIVDGETLASGAAGALEWGRIGPRVGYVRLQRFSGFTQDPQPRPAQYRALEAALEEMRSQLSQASTLIVDVALNGGGSDAAAQLAAAFFADTRRPALRYEAAGTEAQQIVIEPHGEPETRPVLLLTSEVTASAAESFVLMMRAFPHVTHVGEPTRGGLSSLLPKPFPNGFQVTLSYQRVLDAEGRLFEGRGIPPERALPLFPDSDLHGGLARALLRLAEGADSLGGLPAFETSRSSGEPYEAPPQADYETAGAGAWTGEWTSERLRAGPPKPAPAGGG